MFSRHETREEESKQIPEELLKFINNLIHETFHKSFSEKGLSLSVYGEMYENEIVLIFSLIKSNDHNMNTISLFISDDIDKNSKLEKKVDYLINSSSEFFETICQSSDEEIVELYSPRWQKTDLTSENFFYKISRENIELTIEANKLLND